MLEVQLRRRLAGFTLDMAFEHETGVLALFGPSGAGKSMTLRAIAGAIRPDSGRIVIDGEPVFDSARGIDLPPERRRVGYVPQNYALFPHLTVAKNIAFGLGRLPAAERNQRVHDLLSLLDLTGLSDRLPAMLSGGQQQRVALARALATRPRLLLLDEPFTALDGPLRRTLRRELVSLSRRFHTPVVLVSHDLADAQALDATLVVLDRGLVLQHGSVSDVIRRPAGPQVARIAGARNLLTGRVRRAGPAGLDVEVGPLVLQTPAAEVRSGDFVTLAIAPESILLVRPERNVPEGEPVFAGEVIEDSQFGPVHTLTWRPAGAADPSADLDIDIAAGPYHDLDVLNRRHWRIRIPREAVQVLEVRPE